MKIVRFLIEIDLAWKGTITSEAADPGWSIPREMRKLEHTGQRFYPFPKTGEMPLPGEPDADDGDLPPGYDPVF